jgi:nucleoside-diphosphate-sugar epimerase
MTQADNARNVLVTGATGFIGGHLVEALLEKGYSVTCLVRGTSNTRALQKRPVKLVVGDLNDLEPIREAADAIHTVFHVAGAIKAARRGQYFRINQYGTLKLLETLAEANPHLGRFVHISSLAAAGPSVNGRGLTEEEKPKPVSWYGESKLESEREVLGYAKTFPVTILRPSAVYGPGDRETLLLFRMIKRGCLFAPGRLTRRFSLIHVDDLVAAIIGASQRDIASGEIFFLSRSEVYSWEEIGRSIARALNKRYRQIRFPQWLAETAGMAGDLWAHLVGRPATINSQKVRELLEPSWICDSSKARASLGFCPAIDLETGIEQTVRWYQNQGWL